MKPKVAFFSLTSCEGCQFAVLDLGNRFLELEKKIDIVDHRLIEEDSKTGKEKYDIAFMEGVPVVKEDFDLLKNTRKRVKILISLGNCADMGGIYRIKNYRDKDKLFKYVYGRAKGIANPNVKKISDYVKVDFAIPTCPVNAEEFLNFVYSLLAGKKPEIIQNPICYECQSREYECLLQKGLPCFGPIIQGGCGAICLESKMPCYGCRGLLDMVDKQTIEKLIQTILKGQSEERVRQVIEVFGLRDEVEEKLKTKNKK